MQQAFQAGGGVGPAAASAGELEYLKRQSEVLSQQLESIRKRIDDLEKSEE
jgi:prefoldin subunit 5